MTLRRQASRFLAVGAVNTAATYVLFVVLGLFVQPSVAYTIAFAAGLLWVMFGTSTFVFGSSSAPRIALFGVWYLGMYAVGQLVIAWVDPHNLSTLVVTSAVILTVTVPLSFLVGRVILTPVPSPQLQAKNERTLS